MFLFSQVCTYSCDVCVFVPGTAPCKGDAGGGLVFKNEIDERFYVHGILSLSHAVRGECNIQLSELFTKIASHYDWLEKSISQFV